VQEERSAHRERAAVAIKNDMLEAQQRQVNMREYDILRTPEDLVDDDACVITGVMIQPGTTISRASQQERCFTVDYLATVFPRQTDVSSRDDAFVTKPSDITYNDRCIKRISEAICCVHAHFMRA